MAVTKVEAKSKLSQNRSVIDQGAIIEDLLNSNPSPAHKIAQEMQKNLDKN